MDDVSGLLEETLTVSRKTAILLETPFVSQNSHACQEW